MYRWIDGRAERGAAQYKRVTKWHIMPSQRSPDPERPSESKIENSTLSSMQPFLPGRIFFSVCGDGSACSKATRTNHSILANIGPFRLKHTLNLRKSNTRVVKLKLTQRYLRRGAQMPEAKAYGVRFKDYRHFIYGSFGIGITRKSTEVKAQITCQVVYVFHHHIVGAFCNKSTSSRLIIQSL